MDGSKLNGKENMAIKVVAKRYNNTVMEMDSYQFVANTDLLEKVL